MLAIFTHLLGTASETFIRRHIERIAPGETVVICERREQADKRFWDFDGPVLEWATVESQTLYGVARRSVARKFGQSHGTAEGAVRSFLKEHGVTKVLIEYLPIANRWQSLLEELELPTWVHGHGFDVYMHTHPSLVHRDFAALNKLEGVIAMSEHARNRLVKEGVNEAKVETVFYGVEVSEKAPEPIANAKVGSLRSCSIGRMVGKKAPIFLLDAIRRASAQGIDFHHDLVGSGPLFSSAKQFIHCMGLTESIEVHGALYSRETQALLAQSEIYIQHSIEDEESGDCEGMPLAILEAMALGKPVVSTRHTGIPEAVIHGESGFLVDEGDTVKMSEYLVELGQDKDLRQEMGLAAWTRALGHFTAEREAAVLREILQTDNV